MRRFYRAQIRSATGMGGALKLFLVRKTKRCCRYMNNGDKVTGEIKALQYVSGKLASGIS